MICYVRGTYIYMRLVLGLDVPISVLSFTFDSPLTSPTRSTSPDHHLSPDAFALLVPFGSPVKPEGDCTAEGDDVVVVLGVDVRAPALPFPLAMALAGRDVCWALRKKS